ncbi:MAG: hypothetical protein ACOY94_13860 [Bacillota bacterium]
MATWIRSVRSGAAYGWFFTTTLVLGAAFGGWRAIAADGAPLVDAGRLSPAATIAFSTAGLVSLFLSMFYQRRFARADELLRELAVVREPMHPDYRAMLNLGRGWAGGGVDPRWVDKHERTLRTISRFREYRQLFVGLPPFAVAATAAFTLLVGIAVLSWLATMALPATWLTFTNLALLALTVELLGQLLLILWRITLFPNHGADEALHERLGIPSWYRLLDVRYLSGRALPFTALVSSHETYLCLRREEGDWALTIQLPLPLRGWSWACRVVGPAGEVLAEREGRVELTAAQADRFFSDAGLWLDVVVARWPLARTGPDRFGGLSATVALAAEGDPRTLLLTVPERAGEGEASWYGDGVERGEPYRYPLYAIRHVSGAGEAGGGVRLLRPQP